MAKTHTIVMIGAHPDDIETLMGGTLIKYINQGHNVHMIIATDGGKGGKGVKDTEILTEIRRDESFRAAAVQGLTPIMMDFKDGDLLYERVIHEALKRNLEILQPDLILTHDPCDYHADHRTLSRIVVDCAGFIPVLYADTFLGVNFEPEFYVNVTDEMEIKYEMIRTHKSQNPELLIDLVNIQSRFRGAQYGYKKVKYAEAFRAMKKSQCLHVRELLPKEAEVYDLFDFYML